jgi:hypothetical protein
MARSQGKRLGRRPVSENAVERSREQLATGAGIRKTAKAFGVGTGMGASVETRDGGRTV